MDQEIIGTAGIHDYSFLLPGADGNPAVLQAAGLCDLGIIPAMRGRGCAAELQNFVMDRVRHETLSGKLPLIVLYTDKPGVYTGRGWREYHPDAAKEIRTEDFPSGGTFRLDASKIGKSFLTGTRNPETFEEKTVKRIRQIYEGGAVFPGKVVRSWKTWQELFSDPQYHWRLEETACFLYAGERLIEGYSTDPEHPVNGFTPVNGGSGDNKVMLNILYRGLPETLERAIRNGKLQFPVADIF